MVIPNRGNGAWSTARYAEKKVFTVGGTAAGMEGDMGLAEKSPAGSDYPATLSATTAPSTEYAKDASSVAGDCADEQPVSG